MARRAGELKKRTRADRLNESQKHAIRPAIARERYLDPLTMQQSIVKARIEELRQDLPHLYGWKFYPWAREFFESRNRMNLLCAANQIGKALADETLVPTPNGYIKIGDIAVGDIVYGQDGLPTKVIGVPFSGISNCYKIIFDDGSEVIASDAHRWVCKTSKERFRRVYTPSARSLKGIFNNKSFDTWTEATTEEIVRVGKYSPTSSSSWNRVSIPVCKPIDKEDKGLFDPYLVGLLLGDGGLTGATVILTTGDEEIAEYVKEKYGAKSCGKYGYRLNGMAAKLREIGIMGHNSLSKRVPKEFLQGSKSERLLLLYGLMDSDGTISNNAISFSTISEGLKDDFVELVTSLGGKAKVKKRKSGYRNKDGKYIKCNDCFEIRINILDCPFKLKRKADKFFTSFRRHERIIYSVEPVGAMHVTCITVDNADGTFLCTKNHIVTHNSSIAIRKNIEWACNKKLWPELWETVPKQFWYFYPTDEIATTEVEKKWIPEFMPRGEMKNHENYGWDSEYNHGCISALHFRSGVSIYFKSYGMKTMNLQGSTIHMITADEEMPEEHLDELLARLRTPRGYFNQVFTATRGLQVWYRAMECIGLSQEAFPQAWKRTISMRDCQFYDDGTESIWTPERVREAESYCTTMAEILKRIDGRFVKDEGRKYSAFDVDKNQCDAFIPIPKEWRCYGGVDIGSGGRGRSAGAIVFVAVSPDNTAGRVVRSWRGDYEETTARDILDKFKELKKGIRVIQSCYDYQSREFGLIAQRSGEPFLPADKGRDSGTQILNTLFQSGALKIDSGAFDNGKIVTELMSVPTGDKNRKFQDDLTDALRYVIKMIPWDFNKISPNKNSSVDDDSQEVPDIGWTDDEYVAWEIRQRRGEMNNVSATNNNEWKKFEEEIRAWNDVYEGIY